MHNGAFKQYELFTKKAKTEVMLFGTAKTVNESMIVPILTYNCIVNLNLTRSKVNKLTSLELDNRAKLILGQEVCPLLNRINKHAVLVVAKCLTGKVCFSFSKYFNLLDHSRSTRNNGMSLKILKVKLEFARSGFFFHGCKNL